MERALPAGKERRLPHGAPTNASDDPVSWEYFPDAFRKEDQATSSAASRMAAAMLSGRAIPLPAISNAVP